jgi:hypothetical protein
MPKAARVTRRAAERGATVARARTLTAALAAQGAVVASASASLMLLANLADIEANRLQTQADKADEAKKDAQDHVRAVKDAIRKMLDMLAELNRATSALV